MHPNYNCNYSVLALTSAIATVPSSIECNATHFQLHLQCSTIEHNAMQLHLQCRSQITPRILVSPCFLSLLITLCVFVSYPINLRPGPCLCCWKYMYLDPKLYNMVPFYEIMSTRYCRTIWQLSSSTKVEIVLQQHELAINQNVIWCWKLSTVVL